MVLDNLKKPVSKVKLATVLLGVILMGLGIHSFFKSAWYDAGIYHVCDNFSKNSLHKCPGISKERFFVAVVIIHFFVSIASFVVTLLGIMKDNVKMKWGDIGYHVVMGLLLLLSSVLYMVSAEQIHKLANADEGGITVIGLKLLRGEKLVAGIFGFIQGILYGVVSFFVFRED